MDADEPAADSAAVALSMGAGTTSFPLSSRIGRRRFAETSRHPLGGAHRPRAERRNPAWLAMTLVSAGSWWMMTRSFQPSRTLRLRAGPSAGTARPAPASQQPALASSAASTRSRCCMRSPSSVACCRCGRSFSGHHQLRVLPVSSAGMETWPGAGDMSPSLCLFDASQSPSAGRRSSSTIAPVQWYQEGQNVSMVTNGLG